MCEPAQWAITLNGKVVDPLLYILHNCRSAPWMVIHVLKYEPTWLRSPRYIMKQKANDWADSALSEIHLFTTQAACNSALFE